MEHTKETKQAFSKTSLALAVATALTSLASPASAQEEPMLEEVLITGSRISRASFDNLQPGVVVDSEYMNDRGYENVAEALTELPAFGLGTSNSGRQQSASVGQNFVNAFGLGTQRTLVLVNGRRVVGQNTPGLGSAAPSGLQVDLNIIPTAMIERVETIFIGGAPTYGSDAVAGTVNLIYKDDFEGFSFDAQTSQDERGEAENSRIRGLFGANSADGKSNVMLAMEYSTVKDTPSVDNPLVRRGTAYCENPAAGLNPATGFPIVNPADGIPDTVICDNAYSIWQVPNSGMPLDPSGQGFLSANGNGALRNAQGNPLMFDTAGNLVTWDQANLGAPRNLFWAVTPNSFENDNFVSQGGTSNLIAPLDRWIVNGTGHTELFKNTNLFAEVLYARSESGDNTPNPLYGTVFFAPGAQGTPRLNIAENPYVSQELRDVLELNGAYDPMSGEDQFFAITRSHIDIMNVTPDVREQDVMRFVVGLDGEFTFLGESWNWDAAFNFGQTNSTTSQTRLNGRRLALAIDAVTNPETGEIVCRATLDPPETGFGPTFNDPVITDFSECVPFNPIGLQDLGGAQRSYLLQKDFQNTTIKQTTYDANIAGNLFNLPAGPVGIAAGVTHRREESDYDVDRTNITAPDPIDQILPVSGEFDTNEVYVETLIPLLERGSGFELPFVSSLQFEGAIRYVDNSVAGSDLTWTAGGRLRPELPVIGDGLTLRGNFTRSIRSPSVQELFLPESEFQGFAQDPCDPEFLDQGPNPALRESNCRAEVASLKAAGALDTDFDFDDFDSLITSRSDRQFTGGNQNLDNETADGWTVGVVLSPENIPDLTVSLDWTSITINDEIVTLSATQIMNGCYDSAGFPNVEECDRFERDFNYQVRNPRVGFVNAAKREFAGLVGNVSYRFAGSQIAAPIPGDFEVFGSFLYTDKQERTVGDSLNILRGERGFEEWNGQLNLRWGVGRSSLLWQMQHFGAFKTDVQAGAERFAPGENGAKASQIHNATWTYQLTDSIRLRAIVNNVFDERDDRRRRAATLSGDGAAVFDPLDVIGRRYSIAIASDF